MCPPPSHVGREGGRGYLEEGAKSEKGVDVHAAGGLAPRLLEERQELRDGHVDPSPPGGGTDEGSDGNPGSWGE